MSKVSQSTLREPNHVRQLLRRTGLGIVACKANLWDIWSTSHCARVCPNASWDKEGCM